ncbi:hypothetical protein TNCV_522601 [Trichonephila clavipes]|nr:hypothetical protein TNCV_522601 [Trichonephila clavipes]
MAQNPVFGIPVLQSLVTAPNIISTSNSDAIFHLTKPEALLQKITQSTLSERFKDSMVGSDVVQSGRPIFDDFFQHLWPNICKNAANVVFQMVKRLWLIRIDQ